MSRVDHHRRNTRDRVARQGSDNILDFGLPGGLTPPRQRVTKASLRAELETATVQITRLIHCQCGHRATVAIPASWRGRMLKCSKCDARVPA
ncbi:hypothetical protein ASE36_19010 [Rhizobium sp. Root274]|nr:hypothetical protein ASC71_20065 [Rhizobium sp. Root1240]KRD27910.1 hypothetical protein ASE36_19010 [Rhizobium sp. Root274]